MSENRTEKKTRISVKNVLRALSLLCLIFGFCPSFLVSCSGEEKKVNVMTAVEGVSVYGERVVDPHPIMLICLLIPIVFLVVLFVKKLTEKKAACIILAGSAIDTAVWLVFRASVKKLAEENYLQFKTTVWFGLNIAALIGILALSALVIAGILRMEQNITEVLSDERARGALRQASSAVNLVSGSVVRTAGDIAGNIGGKKESETPIGYCAKCGTAIAYGCCFCTSCGTPVPKSLIEEAERKAAETAAAKAAEEAEAEQSASEVCPMCGAEADPATSFCMYCGNKLN